MQQTVNPVGMRQTHRVLRKVFAKFLAAKPVPKTQQQPARILQLHHYKDWECLFANQDAFMPSGLAVNVTAWGELSCIY